MLAPPGAINCLRGETVMTFAVGTRLGAYSITDLLGVGGMGEIYRARDERLGRDVALKIVADHLRHDDDELLRFEREAHTLAVLSHPNILGIYDFGEAQGVRFAVTELLVGETLDERLRRGPLPWRTAAAIASAIAQGLAAAHARGIVHRDIKPANVFLLADGGVKILDFGLARLTLGDSDVGVRVPKEGVFVGTKVYMSPEQVSGEPADARSDIFCLGCVLYEMLIGRAPFSRLGVAATMAAILHEEPPPLATRGKAIPPALAALVAGCLAKEPKQRFQAALDLAFGLNAIISTSRTLALSASWPVRVLLFAAGVLTGIGLTLATLHVLR
jgi:eukaryotic-like serine/threonine-protein kinase